MTQRFLIGVFASVVYRALDGFARPIGAALVLAVAVIGLLVTAAAMPLAPSSSTVVESTGSQPPTVAPEGPNDRAFRANQDGYLEGLVRALDHDS
jgi:hypothetical protein